ncbi:glycoside hydrolase family 18 protein [Terriglobus aquaticus]|uniref:chitinase n=1 Tax=Terriglobus aquaticus TaxID=940139 RepID=A0ABW9KM43_9BACT|nr:glycosyl hydrolase family 18 protein [Terriglobus aquaticus]
MRGVLFLLALVSWPAAMLAQTPTTRPRYEVVGYVFSRGHLLDGSRIAATKMTRINDAFFRLKDGRIAAPGEMDAKNLATLLNLRKQNPQLQVLISVGGGGAGSAGFSELALSAEGRRRFVDSAVEMVERYGLDGVDVDWEYPGYTHVKGMTVRPEDGANYTLLLKELRQRFDGMEQRLGRPLVTSSATGATQIWLDHTDMRAASQWLSAVNLMCYDWYNETEKNTGHDSPLRTSAADPKQISIDDAVRKNLAAGVPARKIVVGVPFYGRRWEGVDPANHGLWQPIHGAGSAVEFWQVAPLVNQQGFVRYWDGTAAAPYLYNATTHTFITYNDAEADMVRTAYVKQLGLGGIMFWQYTGDPGNVLLDAIDAGFGMGGR